MVVVETFEDRAETGKGRLNRAGYMRLQEAARRRDRGFDAILILTTSRWGRNTVFEMDIQKLEAVGVKVIPVSAPWLAVDRGARKAYAFADEMMSIQNGNTTYAHQSYNARLGNRNGGLPPDGYAILKDPTDRKDKRGDVIYRYKLRLDTEPGPFDKTTEPRYKAQELAFTLAEQGKGPRAIGKELFRLGFRKRTADEPIPPATIRTWFTNPAYAGYSVWARGQWKMDEADKRKRLARPIAQWVISDEPTHPAIVPVERFKRIALRYMPKDQSGPGRPPGSRGACDSTRYLLSGMLECALCGSKYVAGVSKHAGKKTHVYMLCNSKSRFGKEYCPNANLNVAIAEAAIFDALLQVLLAPENLKAYVEAYNDFVEEASGGSSAEMRVARDEEERAAREIANIKKVLIEGADVKLWIKELEERQGILERASKRMLELREAGAAPKLSYEKASADCWTTALRGVVLEGDRDMRRAVLKLFVKRVVVSPDKTAKMTWDLPADLLGRREVPVETLNLKVLKEIGCGGLQFLDADRFLTEIHVSFNPNNKQYSKKRASEGPGGRHGVR